MIRKMQESDIPRVAEIHVFGWRSAYRGIVPDEHLFCKMQVARSMERFTQMLTDPDTQKENYVYDDGIVKGLLTIGPTEDEDKPNAFELWGIYIEPFFKGQSIGTALTRYCEEVAIKLGYNEIILWTFEKNAPARAFYEKLGYVTDGKTQMVGSYNAVGVRYTKQI